MRRRLQRFLAADDDPALLEPLLDTLEVRGLLSDRRFAAGLSRTRSTRFGSARVAGDLRARGVDEALIREAVKPLAASELERAKAVFSRRYANPPASAAERARRTRFLAGRGFSYEIIRQVVGRNSDDEPPPDNDVG